MIRVSDQIALALSQEFSHLFSFRWPSVVYALDILAWDWFFALSMLFAATVFKSGTLEKTVRILIIIRGVLTMAGLVAVAGSRTRGR